METAIIVVVVILLVIYLISQNSKKETKKERYGEAVGNLAGAVADTVKDVAFTVTEPKEKRAERLAKEEIAERNGRLYRFHHYSSESADFTDLLKVDDNFNDILKKAGMTPELWKRVGRKLFYLGTIRWFSRDSFDYTQKNTDNARRRTAEGGDLCGRRIEPDTSLLEALDFYKIDKEEWIKFGDSVISMYDIDQDAELKEYGYYPQLKEMNNNFHLF